MNTPDTKQRVPHGPRVTWEGVVKVQRSLATSLPAEQCLIYNESRTIMHQQEMPASIRRWFEIGEPKFYAYATFKDGELKIERRVEEQSW